MLTPTDVPITSFKDSFEPTTEYRLSNVCLEIPNERTGVFTADVHGPPNATAWVRAWISNEELGGLGEAEVAEVPTGAEVSLRVIMVRDAVPELACIRIESEPLATKHTLHYEF
ncbi:MAG: hypothetical protein AB8G99_12525 [Planctomycetaceae bacterium]